MALQKRGTAVQVVAPMLRSQMSWQVNSRSQHMADRMKRLYGVGVARYRKVITLPRLAPRNYVLALGIFAEHRSHWAASKSFSILSEGQQNPDEWVCFREYITK